MFGGAGKVMVTGGLLLSLGSAHGATGDSVLRIRTAVEARSCEQITATVLSGLDRYSVKREPEFRLSSGEFADITVISGLTLEAPPATEQLVLRSVQSGAACEVSRIESPERFYALVARLEIGKGRLTMTGQGLGCPPPNRIRSNVRAIFEFSPQGLIVQSVRTSSERNCVVKDAP